MLLILDTLFIVCLLPAPRVAYGTGFTREAPPRLVLSLPK